MSWSQPTFEALACLIRQRTGLTFDQRQDSAEHQGGNQDAPPGEGETETAHG